VTVEDVLEAQAVEEPGAGEPEPPDADVRRLPEPLRSAEVEAWRGEMRTAAIAAGAGVVAGAATVVAVRAVRSSAAARKGRRGVLRRRQQPPASIIASRSFLVDVHLLGR